MTITPPDSHHFLAATGWLELGNPFEAKLELGKIGMAFCLHPDVLQLSWQIHAQTMEWEKCIAVARELTRMAPNISFGWIDLSFTLHELKRTREAHENLIGVLERFPDEWLMRYNLACYACQLGNLAEAQRWLVEAGLKGDTKEVDQMAKDDPDLTPLFCKQ